jgi:hypothetical protein
MEREYSQAISKGDKPLAVSALNSLIWKIGDTNKERKLEYLNWKYNLVVELDQTKLADEAMGQILRLDPGNLKLKAEFIKKLFKAAKVFEAFTEYMRFEALVEQKLFIDSKSYES